MAVAGGGYHSLALVAVPPWIIAPPQSQTVNQGSTAAFRVMASGMVPLSYQWQFNGTNLAGAVADTLTLAGAQPEQAGSYAVVITNSWGSVTSAVASLTVLVPPSILTPPRSQTVNQGGTATFSVEAGGTVPLSYQWRLIGVDVGGATSSDYSMANVQTSHAGDYAVVVTNACGSVTSVVATLTVNRVPVARDFTAATLQNRPLTIATAKLVARASDPDGDPLTVSAVSPASTNGGGVTLSGSGVTYTPVSGFAGSDSFTYTLSDGRGGTATASVLVSVQADTSASPNMLPLMTTASGTLIRFGGIVGRTYSVQRATAVSGPWETLGTVTIGSSGLGSFEDTNPPAGNAFYRTRYP